MGWRVPRTRERTGRPAGTAGRGGLSQLRDRILGSDPGLSRLRQAVDAAVAMTGAMVVEFGFGRLTHAGAQGTLVAMMLGTVIAMMGSMALAGSAARPKIRTAVFFPVAIGVGLYAGIAVADSTALMLAVFVLVMSAAVYVRKLGVAFFFYGFMTWMGFFFAAFLKPDAGQVPAMLAAVAVSTAWVLLLSLTVLRINPKRTLLRIQHAFGARARAVAGACADLLAARDPARRARALARLHARQLRLAEAALMIEAWSAERGALPEGWSAPALRRRLLDAQLAVDALAAAAESLPAHAPGAEEAARLADLLARREYEAVARAAAPLLEATGATPAARHLAAAAQEYVGLARQADRPPVVAADAAGSAAFEPAVTLALGALPGSASVAGDVDARGHRWNRLARLSLNTRQSVQVAAAGALSIVVGREISEARYYWAVIAAFIAFTGTATRSETFIKAANRVVGTLVGLVAGVALAHLTAGHTTAVLAVIVLSMALGFYLVRISYACMIFFVTIMVSQLYSVLNEFSAGLLVLRLEETAAGAAVGILVALVVLPTSTRDTVHSARGSFFSAVAELLHAVSGRLDGSRPDTDLDPLARAVDNQLRALSLVAAPLTRPLVWGNDPRLVRHRLSLYAAVARRGSALVGAPRRVTDPRRQAELAASCRALGDAAARLAEHPDWTRTAIRDVTRLLARAEAALLGHRPECAGPLPPVSLPLRHLARLLRELTTVPDTASPAPRRTPPPPRGRLLASSATVRPLSREERTAPGGA